MRHPLQIAALFVLRETPNLNAKYRETTEQGEAG
jgi:hypothetical protein